VIINYLKIVDKKSSYFTIFTSQTKMKPTNH
jgi:hypothetical protein